MLSKKVQYGLVSTLLGFTAGSASAIQIFPVDANGNVVGGPIATTWTVYAGSPAGDADATDVSAGAQTDWAVRVGVTNFGSAEFALQTSAIRGAGTLLPNPTGPGVAGYKVEFKFDGYTWDSYGTLPTPNPGASIGYWDAFAVNINQAGYYWQLVNGGTGGLGDPIVTPDPSGTAVIDNTILAGVTWAYGGLDYAAGLFEEDHGTYSITLLGGSGDYYVSAVLDTATNPDADTSYPSWGCYNIANSAECPKPSGGVSQDAPEPLSLALFGIGLGGLALARRRKHARAVGL